MNLLLDTHILLWALVEDDKLPKEAVQLIEDGSNNIYYSIASIWETEIKNSLGKLPISGQDLSTFCKSAGFLLLPLKENHIFTINSLRKKPSSHNHNDPFDKVMIAQAKAENYVFITHDALIAEYDESCIKYL